VWIVQIGLGGVLLLSGFSKLADPYGFYYKLVEYARVWHIWYLEDSFPLLTGLFSAFEFTLGGNILFGNSKKQTSRLLFYFLIVMTIFSIYLYVKKPVEHCGCFGELWKVSAGGNLLKNFFLLGGAFYFYRYNERFHSLFTTALQWFIEIFLFFFATLSCWFFWNYGPLVETQPFKEGIHIFQSMNAVSKEDSEIYSTTLIYEKEGKEEEFTLENYPYGDTSYHYVRTITKLLKKGSNSTIEPFEIINEEGKEVTEELLTYEGYSFLLIVPHFYASSKDNIDQLNLLYDYCVQHQYPFHCITASNEREVEVWHYSTGSDYPIYFSDETTLRSMLRSTSGIILLKDGIIVDKISINYLSFGEEEDLEKDLDVSLLPYFRWNPTEKSKLFLWVLFILVPLLLIFLFEKTTLLIVWTIRLAVRKIMRRKGDAQKEEVERK